MHASGPGLRNASPRATLVDTVDSFVPSLASFGMHANLSARPADTSIQFGMTRNVDCSIGGTVVHWRTINTASNTFDWTNADAFVNAQVAAGCDIIFNVGNAPDWTVAGSATGSPAYGGKSNQPPDNDSDWTAWITALVTRYAGKIKFYEGWNEPNLTKYWAGTNATYARLARLQKLLYQTVKSIDPAAIVLSPPYTSVFAGASGLTSYLAASDGGTGTGKDWFDRLGYHYYCNDDSRNVLSHWTRMHQPIVAAMTAAGISSREIIATETGCITPTFLSLTTQQQSDLLRFNVIGLLAMGVRRVVWYACDNATIGFAAGTAAVWNSVVNSLVGKTIVRRLVQQTSPSSITASLYLADGSTVSQTVTGMPVTTPAG